MAGTSADIEALLVNVNDPDDPTPAQLPAIFRDIVARLNAHQLAYAVFGRIALTRYDRARYCTDIEIVAAPDAAAHALALVKETQERFAPYTNPRTCANAITLSLRPCSGPVEARLLSHATTCTWFGIETRLASPEHLLWFWCHSDTPDHRADADALIRSAAVDLYRVQELLRETDDLAETAQMRLRLAIGGAVLASEFSFSRFMEERRARLHADRVPVWRLPNNEAE